MKTETRRQTTVREQRSEIRDRKQAPKAFGTQHATRTTQHSGSTCNFQPATCNARPQPSTPPPSQDSVQNADGFWELSFAGQRAILPQHQGLFYVAYLLANPHGAPITGVELAAEVFERYGQHEDFREYVPSRSENDARVAKILLQKQTALEAILDREDEDDFVKVEALRELMVIDELKRIHFSQIAREAKNTGEIVSDLLRELHAMLATAVDVKGNPHRVIRDFGMHLLHYVLMPSDRVSQKEKVALFVYRPT